MVPGWPRCWISDKWSDHGASRRWEKRNRELTWRMWSPLALALGSKWLVKRGLPSHLWLDYNPNWKRDENEPWANSPLTSHKMILQVRAFGNAGGCERQGAKRWAGGYFIGSEALSCYLSNEKRALLIRTFDPNVLGHPSIITLEVQRLFFEWVFRYLVRVFGKPFPILSSSLTSRDKYVW